MGRGAPGCVRPAYAAGVDLFAHDYGGGAFVLLGPAHLAALLTIVAGNVWLVRHFRGAAPDARRRVARIMAVALWTQELGYHAWRAATGTWNVQEMLPLHLCSMLVWLGGIMLWSGDARLFDFAWFLGLAGASQALLTPDIGPYGFPHYRFFQCMFSHGMIVTAALWMSLVEGLRPSWRSVGRVLVVAHLYAAAVFAVNLALGSNYLYVNRKPATASAMDLMPAWPGYLVWLEGLLVLFLVALYLPWAVGDARRLARARASGS